MNIKITPVLTKSDKSRFIKSQWLFYKNDPYWVPPLLMDREKTLNTEKNPFYKHSEIQLFLAESDDKIVGRIAAIVNDNHNATHHDKVGFFGFFECIDNQEVANALFKAAEEWLRKHGMNVMRGPENPSMNDEIGLLIEGFDSSPVLLMTYNPEYYIKLVENAGLDKAKDLYAYQLVHQDYASDKMKRLQNMIRERNNITIREVNFKNKAQFHKDVDTIKEIYNSAWVPNWGFVKWTNEEFDFIAADLKLFVDPRLALIAECNGKIAGFALALPNINESLIHNKSGGTLGALWHMKTKKNKVEYIRIIALGIMPEFQKTGVDSVLYYELGERGHNSGKKFGEASWVLEDNTMMNRGLTVTMNGKLYKKYRLYDKAI
jgi:GNAT superfamily N-acetyltransferase